MKIIKASPVNTALKIIIVTGLSTSLFSQPSLAESHPGKALHESADCMKCHTAKPYNPQASNSYPKLLKAVEFCNNNLNVGLFEDEIEQLADYLNQTYYHHSK